MRSPATVSVERKRRSQTRAGQNSEIAAFIQMLFAAELYRSRRDAPTIERPISSDNEPLELRWHFGLGS
jgi:hypothetical protein